MQDFIDKSVAENRAELYNNFRCIRHCNKGFFRSRSNKTLWECEDCKAAFEKINNFLRRQLQEAISFGEKKERWYGVGQSEYERILEIFKQSIIEKLEKVIGLQQSEERNVGIKQAIEIINNL